MIINMAMNSVIVVNTVMKAMSLIHRRVFRTSDM